MKGDLINRSDLLKKFASEEFRGMRGVIFDSDGWPTHIPLAVIKSIITSMPPDEEVLTKKKGVK